MDKKTIKNIITLITYTAVLILIIINFKPLMQTAGYVLALFQPLIIGLTAAFILNRPCMFIRNILDKKVFKNKNKSLSGAISIIVTFLLVIIIVIILISFIIPQLIQNVKIFWSNVGVYLINLQNIINSAAQFFNIKSINLSSLGTWILNYINQIGSSITLILSQIINITSSIFSFITTFVISAIFAIYLLAGKEKLLYQFKKLFRIYLPEKLYSKSAYVLGITVDTFNRYIIGQLTEALILGTLCFVGMSIFKFDYPLLISVLIGITALIPMIGAYIGGAVAFLLLLMVSPMKAVWFLVFLVVLQQFEGNIIYPRVVGNSLGLPGIWILLSVMVGGGIAGPVGILLGVPVATVIFKLIKNDINMRSAGKVKG